MSLYRFEAVGPAGALETALERAGGDPPLGLSASLFEHGDPSVARLELLFDAPPDLDAVIEALGLDEDAFSFALGQLDARDWVAVSLEGLPPVSAGRFTLRGSHHPPRRGGIDIVVEAGEAFGTGHHATTLGCLKALDDLLKREGPRRRFRTALDLGTGTGALAVAFAKATRRPALASDIDPIAVRVAAENARANGAGRLVKAIEADGLAHPLLRKRRFDLVLANILAGPLQTLAGDVVEATEPGGVIVLSGLLEPQARAVLAAYRARGAVLVRRYVIDGWASLVLARGGAGRSNNPPPVRLR
ncbi:MAG: 50S ribosomal protein L11 methyltransferase [Maricaulaceae bacterium]|jgi:ribosomal protein L11 methyltransferase